MESMEMSHEPIPRRGVRRGRDGERFDHRPHATGRAVLAAETHVLYALGADRWIGLGEIGLTGTFRWITRDPGAMDPASSDTRLWAPGEPNNFATERCAHFDIGHPDLVNNIDCTSTPHPYTCECDGYANDPTTYP